MNNRKLILHAGLFIAAACVGHVNASTAPAARKAIYDIPLVTNAVPQSVFSIPKTPEEGRDPFFPNSTRLKQAGEAKAPAPELPKVNLIYNGLSGTPDRMLAIINGRTLAEGEQTYVTVGNNRVAIRCVEIKGETVIVEVSGQRRELKLGGDK